MKLATLLILPFLIFSCASSSSDTFENQEAFNSGDELLKSSEITYVQQSAFDALNALQLNSDSPNRLYSTFANIDQPCYPADTSFTISQSQFLIAMKQFVAKHYKGLAIEKQNRLIEKSVKAQEEYQILHCKDYSEDEIYENELPTSGTWILPNVLERRDIILVW